MINDQMKILFEQNKARDDENPAEVEGIWEREKTVLCSSLDDTIAYLKSASPEELFYVSEVFDDISEYWQSEKLIKVMEDAVERCDGEIKETLQTNLYFAKKALKK